MDDLDRGLLALLRVNARAPASKLAEELRVSRGTIQNRIDRMLERGTIQGFTIRARADDGAGRIRAMMCVEIKGERSDAVVKALRGFPQVMALHSTNGRWDLVAELETDSLVDFGRTLDEIRRIPGIAATETNLLLSSFPI